MEVTSNGIFGDLMTPQDASCILRNSGNVIFGEFDSLIILLAVHGGVELTWVLFQASL